jgi:hypothetical protein
MTKNLRRKKYSRKFYLYLFVQELVAFPLDFIKDVQDTGEAFSPQRTSSTSKNELTFLYIFLWVYFALLDPDPDSGTPLNPEPIRIRKPQH